MTKTLKCRDAGLVCRAQITGETDEEILAQALEHARADHGVDLSGSSTFERYLRSLIRDDQAAAERA